MFQTVNMGGQAAPVLPRSEATTVARAQDGDLDAFEDLVNLHQLGLFRFAYRVLQDRGEAEDVVQDALVLAWRKLPTLNNPDAFSAWLYRIAHREAGTVLRVRARRRTQVTVNGDDLERYTHSDGRPPLSGDSTAPAEVVETSEQVRTLDALLATLPVEQRECWLLKEVNDLSYSEISTILAIPVSTVRGRIARARRQLSEGMHSWR